MSLRDSILGATDRKLKPVDVPEWGATVYLRELSAAQVAAFKAKSIAAVDLKTNEIKDAATLTELEVSVCLWGICDEDGRRVFTDNDVKLLGEKSPIVISRLADEIIKMSGVGRTVADAKNA